MPARSLSFLTIAQWPTSPASDIVRNSKPSSASSSPARYVSIISVASCFVSGAASAIAVFLPSKPPATSMQRSAVSAASSCIRSSLPARSCSSSSIRPLTFSVAPFEASASPSTSASLLSKFVSSAIDGLLDLVDDAVAVRAGVLRDDARRLLRQAGGLAQFCRDLLDFLRLRTGSEHGRLRRQVERRRALGVNLLGYFELLAGFRVRAVEDRSELLEVVLGEAVELEVFAARDVRLALGDLLRRDSRRGKQLHHVRAGEVLERTRVRDLVDAAADEQVAGQRTSRRVLDHLVDLPLVVAR